MEKYPDALLQGIEIFSTIFLENKIETIKSLLGHVAFFKYISTNYPESLKKKPTESETRKIFDNIFELFRSFFKDADKINDFLNNYEKYFNKINRNDLTSFDTISIYCIFILKLYEYRLNEVKEGSDENAVIIQVKYLDDIGNVLIRWVYHLIGYWDAKVERMESSIPGGKAQKNQMLNRIEKVKSKIEKTGIYKDDTLEIDRNEWQNIMHEVFEYSYVSHPTLKKYKDIIEKSLANEKGIDLVFKK